MDKRIYFKSKKVRKLFFEKVLSSNDFNKWKDFYVKFSISRKTLDSYKNGRLTIPNYLYEQIVFSFDKSTKLFFEKHQLYMNSNWGRVKGGFSTYSKHKIIFDNGRNKAILNKKNRVPRFNVNIVLDKELSYFIGLFIGDGFTNKYGNYYLTQFTGDNRKEKIYYSEIISGLSQRLFSLIPKLREEKNSNTLRINYYSVDLFRLITDRFKIKAGRKSSEVLIPEEILNSSEDILLSCIAGIYDAEGCFYFDERKSYKNPYPATALHMNNPALIKQISDIFLKNDIKHSCTGNFSTLYIYGKINVKSFLSKIKLLNPKYSKKIELLKSF